MGTESMARGREKDYHRDLDLIAGSGCVAGLDDAELLGRFASRRGDAAEVAFEAIVARHGPMVLGVCRGVLRQTDEADDAFQATFLVLVRKANSVRVADSLAPWLYGVARRVATRARSAALKRRSRESPGGDIDAEPAAPSRTYDDRLVLFEELDRLPEKYRTPVILCHLEGLTHEEAAQRLGWPVGTLSGRLSRARDLLRSRLARRGLGPSSVPVAGAILPRMADSLPSALLRSTARNAATFATGGPVSNSILSLTQGVLIAMLVHKLKLGFAVALGLAMLTATAGYVSGQIGAGPPQPPAPIRDIPGFPKLTEKMREAQKSNPGGMGLGQPTPPVQLTIPVISTPSIVAVTSKDGRSVTAMVVDYGVWHEYRAPEGVWLKPLMSNNVLGLAVSGDEIREVAAFCSSTMGLATQNPRGTWVRQALLQPAKGEIYPYIGAGVAYYQIGNDIYAFSAASNRWGTLHLEGAESPKLVFGMTSILVEQDRTLYVFSVATGEWSKGLKVPNAAGE